MRNYKVEIKEAKGACESEMFKVMAEAGDITAVKVTELADELVEFNGYAVCHVVAGEKEFDINYYATSSGIVSSGSEGLLDSVKRYMGKGIPTKIVKVKTKKGFTYKLSPVLTSAEL